MFGLPASVVKKNQRSIEVDIVISYTVIVTVGAAVARITMPRIAYP